MNLKFLRFLDRQIWFSTILIGLTQTIFSSYIFSGDDICILCQYGWWSFKTGGKELERFLPKNQHSQRKLSNFENWVNREMSKIGHHFRK